MMMMMMIMARIQEQQQTVVGVVPKRNAGKVPKLNRIEDPQDCKNKLPAHRRFFASSFSFSSSLVWASLW